MSPSPAVRHGWQDVAGPEEKKDSDDVKILAGGRKKTPRKTVVDIAQEQRRQEAMKDRDRTVAAYQESKRARIAELAADPSKRKYLALMKRGEWWTDEQIALRLEWLPTCSVEAVTQSHRLFHEEDIFPDFPRLICPTLFIYAAKATVVTPDQAKEIGFLLPNGRTVPVAAGHMIPWDNLQDFLGAMKPFLEMP